MPKRSQESDPNVKGEWVFRDGNGFEIKRIESWSPLTALDWPKNATQAQHEITLTGGQPGFLVRGHPPILGWPESLRVEVG